MMFSIFLFTFIFNKDNSFLLFADLPGPVAKPFRTKHRSRQVIKLYVCVCGGGGVHVCMCACVHVWVCACVGVCMCGCVGVWVCGCVAVWVCGCVAVWLCACVDVFICGCVHVWVCACVWVWVWVRKKSKPYFYQTTTWLSRAVFHIAASNRCC